MRPTRICQGNNSTKYSLFALETKGVKFCEVSEPGGIQRIAEGGGQSPDE